MCATCLKEHQSEDGDINADEWEEYVNRDEEEVIYDDEETGDMASVTDMDDDTDDGLGSGIGFDDSLDDDDLGDLDDELGMDFDDEDDELLDDDEEDDENEEDDDDDF